jgi:putative membrane protein
MTSDEEWHRLHPLSPVISAGSAAVALLVIVLPAFVMGNSDAGSELVHLGIVALLVTVGLVSWLTTRWRIDGNDLRLEKGLVRRSSRRYPLGQVQAIDTLRPGLARLFGLSELRLRMAGSGGDARLAYLPGAKADALRDRLLARAQGAPGDHEPATVERVVVSVPLSRLLGSILLSTPALGLGVYLSALAVAAALSTSAASAILQGTIPFLFGGVIGLWHLVNSRYGATIAEAPDGLRLRSGLVAKSAETIPQGRVQAVRMVEPVAWQLIGWRRLEVDVAGRSHQRHRNERHSLVLLPVGTRAEAERVLALLVPGAPSATSRPPRRAWLKSPLRYRRLAFARDERYAVSVTGRLNRATSWVPLVKIQSLRRVQGPAQRFLRLASLHLDTAGRSVRCAFRDIDDAVALAEIDELADHARSARAEAELARPPRGRATRSGS